MLRRCQFLWFSVSTFQEYVGSDTRLYLLYRTSATHSLLTCSAGDVAAAHVISIEDRGAVHATFGWKYESIWGVFQCRHTGTVYGMPLLFWPCSPGSSCSCAHRTPEVTDAITLSRIGRVFRPISSASLGCVAIDTPSWNPGANV